MITLSDLLKSYAPVEATRGPEMPAVTVPKIVEKPVGPSPEEVTAGLMEKFTDELAVNRARGIFGQWVEFAQGRSEGVGRMVATRIVSGGQNWEEEHQRARREVLAGMGLRADAIMSYGSKGYEEYCAQLERKAEEMSHLEAERVGKLELARAVLGGVGGVADGLVDAAEAANVGVSGAKLLGSLSLDDEKYDGLPQGLRDQVREARGRFEMVRVGAIGRLVLEKGNVVALPVFLATGQLTDSETIGLIGQVLRVLDEKERFVWLRLLRKCNQLIESGGTLVFEASYDRVVVEIEPGGVVRLNKDSLGDHLKYAGREVKTDAGMVDLILSRPGETIPNSVFKREGEW